VKVHAFFAVLSFFPAYIPANIPCFLQLTNLWVFFSSPQLDEDEKNALVKIINSMLTKKRMKDLLDGKAKF